MRVKLVFVFILLVFLLFSVSALDFPKAQDKYVNDFAGVLNSSENAELRDLFSTVDEVTTAEIVFVSLESLEGDEISSFATNLASNWKVGKEDKDNGLLILYVVDINRIWVATGYGLEGILPDSKVGRLLDENYVSLRDSGNINEGIIKFGYAVSREVVENKEEVISGQAGGGNGEEGFDYFLLLIWIIILIVIIGRLSRKRKSVRQGDFPWWALLFLPSGRSQGFGGGSGFGGGGFGVGFGGGGFGGGGAGR